MMRLRKETEGFVMEQKTEQFEIEISEMVEERLQETYQQIRARDRKHGILWRRLGMAVALLGVMLTSFGTAFAMSKGYSVNDLFTKLWGNQSSSSVVEQISGDVKILEEKCTFQDITIEPVKAVVDRLGCYIVLKVTGKNGFSLEEDMVFREITTVYDNDITGVLDAYVLKREKNVMYYALWNLTDQPQKKKKYPEFHIATFDLVRGEGMEALEGRYEADIRCKQGDERVTVRLGQGIEAQIFPLGVYINTDMGEKMGLTKLSEEKQNLHILLKGGKEVKAILSHGVEGKDTVLRAEEPIDTQKVTGVRMLGKTYTLNSSYGSN